MKKVFQNEIFNLGFSCGFVLLTFFNFLSYTNSYHDFSNRPIKFSASGYEIGFPFSLYKVEIGNPNYFCFVWFNCRYFYCGNFLVSS